MSTSTVSPLLKIVLGLIGIWPGTSHGAFYLLFYMMILIVMQSVLLCLRASRFQQPDQADGRSGSHSGLHPDDSEADQPLV